MSTQDYENEWLDELCMPTPAQVETYQHLIVSEGKRQSTESTYSDANSQKEEVLSEGGIPDSHQVSSDSSEQGLSAFQYNSEDSEQQLDQIVAQLPGTLRNCITVFQTPEEKLMSLFGTIVTTGALIPKVRVIYCSKVSYPLLMLLIVFPPASGKGSLSHVRNLLRKIDDHLNKEYLNSMRAYEQEMDLYKHNVKMGQKTSKPIRPSMTMMLIPGNTSSAQIISSLSECSPDNALVMFETEMDAFGITATKSDFGSQNSTIFRQAFEFEPISQMRKTNSEKLSVPCPKLVPILSGTDSQVARVVNPKDGTFSRFLVVRGTGSAIWKDVKPSANNIILDDYFEVLGETFLEMWNYLVKRDVRVTFTDAQYNLINDFGKEKLALIHHFTGEDASSIAKRHGNMIVRIAAILSMVRYWERKDNSQSVKCEQTDFDTAMWMVRLSIDCCVDLYNSMPKQKGDLGDKIAGTKRKLMLSMPAKFRLDEIKTIAGKLSIKDRTLTRWIKEFVDSGYLDKVGHGEYQKTEMASLAVLSLSEESK